MALGRFSLRRQSTAPLVAAELATRHPTEIETDLADAKVEAQEAAAADRMLEAKLRVHHRLVEEINLSAVEKLP